MSRYLDILGSTADRIEVRLFAEVPRMRQSGTVDPVKAVKAWLDLDHEGQVMTLVEDGSFVEWIREVVAERERLRQLVIEAYPGDDWPTNEWRRQAERLNAWPGADA